MPLSIFCLPSAYPCEMAAADERIWRTVIVVRRCREDWSGDVDRAARARVSRIPSPAGSLITRARRVIKGGGEIGKGGNAWISLHVSILLLQRAGMKSKLCRCVC